jgi:hypothetical protein
MFCKYTVEELKEFKKETLEYIKDAKIGRDMAELEYQRKQLQQLTNLIEKMGLST